MRERRGRISHALPWRRYGGGHAGGMAGQARRLGQARRHCRGGRDPERRDRDRNLPGRPNRTDPGRSQKQGAGRDPAGANSNRTAKASPPQLRHRPPVPPAPPVAAPRCGPPVAPPRHRPPAPGAAGASVVASRAAARRRTRHRSFNGHRQRPGGGDHLCRRRAPSRRGRRSAGKEASAVA